MNDLRSALSRVADAAPAAPGTGAVSVDADVARGRRALRRRRVVNGAGTLVLVVAAVGVVRALPAPENGRVAASPGATTAAPASATSDPRTTPTPERLRPVELVAYTGSAPSGYEVEYVPDDWEVQGADPFAMTIAPVGFGDQHPASFVGKLVVMLRSSSDTGTPTGTPIRVGDGTGYLHVEGQVSVVTYKDRGGRWVQVQVPASLGWTADEMGRFAAGVVVTGDAQAGVG